MFLFTVFFMDPTTTVFYTLSLHDALPICICSTPHGTRRSPRLVSWRTAWPRRSAGTRRAATPSCATTDRKSTRLNSSHEWSSYAVFCLKKKNMAANGLLYLAIYIALGHVF